MKKKLLAGILSCAMVFSILPGMALAEEVQEAGSESATPAFISETYTVGEGMKWGPYDAYYEFYTTDGVLTAVNTVSDWNNIERNEMFMYNAMSGIISQYKDVEDTSLDAVSGATKASEAFIPALNAAISANTFTAVSDELVYNFNGTAYDASANQGGEQGHGGRDNQGTSVTVTPTGTDFEAYSLNVSFTVNDNVLTAVSATSTWGSDTTYNPQYTETAMQGIVNKLKAGETLDAVSGATCSSNAIIEAINTTTTKWESVSPELTYTVSTQEEHGGHGGGGSAVNVEAKGEAGLVYAGVNADGWNTYAVSIPDETFVYNKIGFVNVTAEDGTASNIGVYSSTEQAAVYAVYDSETGIIAVAPSVNIVYVEDSNMVKYALTIANAQAADQTITVSAAKTSFTYNASKAQTTTVSVAGNSTDVTYTSSSSSVTVDNSGKVTIKKGTKAGTYTITAAAAAAEGKYNAASATVKLTVKKAAQTLTVATAAKTVKYSKVKKAKQTTAAVKVTGAKTSVAYKKVSGNSKISINAKTGKFTVAKGTKKGTYKIKVMVTAKADTNYTAKAVTKTIKVIVK